MGHCGYKCEFCPAHQAAKKEDPEGLAKCSVVWKQILGRNIQPEQLKCDGCYMESGRKADPNCPVRPCCRQKGFLTCAECTEYPCAHLDGRLVARLELEERIGDIIDEKVYEVYIKPLENKNRLDNLHEWHMKNNPKT